MRVGRHGIGARGQGRAGGLALAVALLGPALAAGARPASGASCSGQEYFGPGGAQYSYCPSAGDGPAAWGSLDADWEACFGEAGPQSPIDVRLEQPCANPFTAQSVGELLSLPQGGALFQPNFGAEGYNGVYPAFACATQENDADEGCGTLTFESSAAPSARATYELQQFHFHSPSENLLNGRQFFLEMHMVFALSEATAAAPQNVVLAVFFEDHSLPHREERGASKALRDLWALWEKPVPGQQLRVDLAKLTDVAADFATFEGSLTTPPCTSGVVWIAQAHPVGADPRLFETYYNDALGGWPGNNRPVQDPAGRVVGGSFCAA